MAFYFALFNATSINATETAERLNYARMILPHGQRAKGTERKATAFQRSTEENRANEEKEMMQRFISRPVVERHNRNGHLYKWPQKRWRATNTQLTNASDDGKRSKVYRKVMCWWKKLQYTQAALHYLDLQKWPSQGRLTNRDTNGRSSADCGRKNYTEPVKRRFAKERISPWRSKNGQRLHSYTNYAFDLYPEQAIIGRC